MVSAVLRKPRSDSCTVIRTVTSLAWCNPCSYSVLVPPYPNLGRHHCCTVLYSQPSTVQYRNDRGLNSEYFGLHGTAYLVKSGVLLCSVLCTCHPPRTSYCRWRLFIQEVQHSTYCTGNRVGTVLPGHIWIARR